MKLRWKILITVILAVLVSYLFGATKPTPQYSLKADFEDYNERFFYGGLPNNTKVIWADLSSYGDYARIDVRPDGSILISVDPKMNPGLEEAQMSLLHEMCHEKLGLHINIPVGDTKANAEGFDGHGDGFEGCMIDLAQRHAFKGLW